MRGRMPVMAASDDTPDRSRRRLLQAGAAVAWPAVLLPASAHAAAIPRNGHGDPGVRTAIGDGPVANAALAAFARAVAALKALPAQDPRSWTAIARQHRDFCPHHNWWFLPWHRAYLHYFEACCRSVLGDPGFRVPYWDWSRQPRLPAPFWAARGALHHARRDASAADALARELAGPEVVAEVVGSEIDVVLYGAATQSNDQVEMAGAGKFEGGPHNAVHAFIGGTMATTLAPTDPAFWPHHANVDRIWASWLHEHQGRVPQEARWHAHRLAAFHDPATGGMVSPPTSATLDADAFGARYDRHELPLRRARPAPRPLRARLRRFDAATDPRLPTLVAEAATGDAAATLRLRFASTPAFAAALDAALHGARTGTRTTGAVLLRLHGLRRVGAASVRVRLAAAGDHGAPGAPPGADTAGHVATLAFFGDDHHRPGHVGHGTEDGGEVVLDATAALAAVAAVAQPWTTVDLDLWLHAVDLSPSAVSGRAPVTVAIRRATLAALR